MRDRVYRKIYEQHYGPIPKDDMGRSYEIHHIDGNHKNNDINNLKAVSLQEHYNIHKDQGDVGACWLMSPRLNLTGEEMSRLGREMAKLAGPRTDEWKRKQSESQKGKKRGPQSEETKRKKSIALKGNPSWNKGRKGVYSEETLERMRQAASNRWKNRSNDNSR